jgi:hypothetical protein
MEGSTLEDAKVRCRALEALVGQEGGPLSGGWRIKGRRSPDSPSSRSLSLKNPKSRRTGSVTGLSELAPHS